jgi:hypothetical protein
MTVCQNVLVGPFIGNFEEEVITFRPYAKWIQTILKPGRMFVATHSNRSFLYDKSIEIINVYEDISRDELGQANLIHESISQKDMILISRKTRQEALSRITPKSKDLLHFNTQYTKSSVWYPLYKKIFQPVDIPADKDDYILFIPHMKEKYHVIEGIYKFLSSTFGNVVVAGDMKTHLHSENVLLKNPTYFKDAYLDITKLITNAKVVVVPYSHWTILSLLQKTPVISWGKYSEYYTNRTPHQIVTGSVSLDNLENILRTFINNVKNF